VDDATAGGATLAGDGCDGWSWIARAPAPSSGLLVNRSVLGAGEHQHYFYNATATLAIAAGDTLFAYVYLDPANPPSQVMLQWNRSEERRGGNGGGNRMGWGHDGNERRGNLGRLRATGGGVGRA